MNKKLAYKLSNASGISGHENEVKQIIKKELTPLVDSFSSDNIGSLIGIKKSTKDAPNIMLAAHMDEVGFIVKQIDDKGFIKFAPVGGWWSQVLLGQRVKVVNSKGEEYIGVIGSTPPHILPKEQRDKVVQIDEMFIDLGVKDKKEIIKAGIKVGDMIVPDSLAMDMLNEDFVLGKAWDNRIGCLMLIEIMKKLKNKQLNCNVYAVATVQEEIGLKGAKTTANVVNPDIALALDTGIGGDTPGIDPQKAEAKLGDGPQFTLMDAGMIIHNGLKEYIYNIANKNKIALQPEILLGGSTDAASINISGNGVPSTCISLATRYIHSHNSIISKTDFDQAVKLVVKMIENLDNKTIKLILGN